MHKAYRRLMGLDVGTKTVGVAVSDLLQLTAQGVDTLHIDEESGEFALDKLVNLIDNYQVDTVVIGLPKNMNNSLGSRAKASLNYGKRLLAVRPELTIVYQDERLTTSQAERMLIQEGNVRRKKRKQIIDKLAAVIILQNYLDQQP